MGDRRHRNKNWLLTPADAAGIVPYDAAQLAVLMDIREVLQEANQSLARIRTVLECTNARRGFIAMQKLRKHLEAVFPSVAMPRRRRKKRETIPVRRRKAKGAK